MFSTAAPSLSSLLLLSTLLSPSSADKEAFYDSNKYNNGDYGDYVTQDFITSPVRAPWINFIRPFTACDDGSYYFVAPRGNVANATPFILDAEGSLVWAPDEHFGEVYNFWVQRYKGEDYLTFWSGDDSIGGHGEGRYHMLDRHYEEYRRIQGAHGIGADLHSFTITPEGTATCTLYDIHEVDVSDVRPDEPTGYVWDALFQELDIETGQALFEWRASEHFNFTESYFGINKATHDDPWDFFHINAVDKDYLGNYLVSSRFLRTIAYIDGKNGDVLWRLGGKHNSFTDLSGGHATNNVGQHDARWTADHSAVTFFDNRGDWYYKADDQSWGARVRLDLEMMTAELEQTYKNPAGIYSYSQGSYQTLPDGHVMIGYGFNGAFTEFTADGEVLCDAYMQPRIRFGSGDVQSYRNMKFHWTGIPKTQPKLVYHQHALYVSWKGSTETRRWLIQDAKKRENKAFVDLKEVVKRGFETRIPLTHGFCTREYVRVIALDAHGEHLATSTVVQLEDHEEACSGVFHDYLAVDDHKDVSQGSDSDFSGGSGSSAYSGLDSDASNNNNNGAASSSEGSDSSYSTPSSSSDDDWTKELEDLQLLLGFGLLALLSGALVAYCMFGPRAFTRFWRHSLTSSGPSSSFLPSDLWARLRAALPGGRRRWWDGGKTSSSSAASANDERSGGRRRQHRRGGSSDAEMMADDDGSSESFSEGSEMSQMLRHAEVREAKFGNGNGNGNGAYGKEGDGVV